MKDYITFLKFDSFSPDELLKHYEQDIADNKKIITETPNLDGLRVAYRDSFIRQSINSADYSVIDGVPVLWLAKITRKSKFKYKISGSDLTPMVLELANKKELTVALFGGKPGVGDRAKTNIEKQYPNVRVVSVLCPEFGFEKDKEVSLRYIQQINDSKANIILLCTGFPKTEQFFFSNYDYFGPGLYFNVGATIDFLAGSVQRAPKWMSKIGFEWLFRLLKDFRRLFKRYWLDFWFLVKMLLLIVFNKKKILRLRQDGTQNECCN